MIKRAVHLNTSSLFILNFPHFVLFYHLPKLYKVAYIYNFQGRGGQGAIHVFPVGPPGNDLVNNEFTIAVSAVGQNGTVPCDHVISSSVITSGLRNGNNITATNMVNLSNFQH